MIILKEEAIKKIQEELEKEKIIYWREVNDFVLNIKTVIFLYDGMYALDIHSKIMKADGWLYDNKENKTITIINKKNKEKAFFFSIEYRKSLA